LGVLGGNVFSDVVRTSGVGRGKGGVGDSLPDVPLTASFSSLKFEENSEEGRRGEIVDLTVEAFGFCFCDWLLVLNFHPQASIKKEAPCS